MEEKNNGNNGATQTETGSSLVQRGPIGAPGTAAQKSALAEREYRDGRDALSALWDISRSGNANVLLPRTAIQSIPPGAMVSLREVAIDGNVYPGGDVYAPKGGQGTVALKAPALERLAQAAGLDVYTSERVDDETHPHYVRWKCCGMIQLFDGTVQRRSTTRTIDLRDDNGIGEAGGRLKRILGDAERSGKKAPLSQIDNEREFIEEHCETKALSRLIRKLLSLKQAYDPKELLLPFVVPALVPDPTHPIVQERLLDRLTGATKAMYSEPPKSIPMKSSAPTTPATAFEKPVAQVHVEEVDDDDGGVDQVDEEEGEIIEGAIVHSAASDNEEPEPAAEPEPEPPPAQETEPEPTQKPVVEKTPEKPPESDDDSSVDCSDPCAVALERSPAAALAACLWPRAQNLGMTGADFKKMCEDATKKKGRSDLALDDIPKIVGALDEYETELALEEAEAEENKPEPEEDPDGWGFGDADDGSEEEGGGE